ncbi:MAG: hypothetical protein QW385_03330 [Thermoproteota archaeon]
MKRRIEAEFCSNLAFPQPPSQEGRRDVHVIPDRTDIGRRLPKELFEARANMGV